MYSRTTVQAQWRYDKEVGKCWSGILRERDRNSSEARYSFYNMLVYVWIGTWVLSSLQLYMYELSKAVAVYFNLTGKIPLRQLVYRVLDLPPSMRPLVYDFGQLQQVTEDDYIRQIVHDHVSERYR